MANMAKSFLGMLLVAVIVSAANADLLNEFEPNPAGTDPTTTTVELKGVAGNSFSGWLVSIESDAGSSAGTIDRAEQVSGTYDSNGLLVVSIQDLENPSFTLVLTDRFTGNVNDDYDAGDDGVLDDLSIFGTIFDALGIPDTTGEPLYGASLGGADFAYTGDEPGLVFRDGTTNAWYAINDPPNNEVYDISASLVDPTMFDADPFTSTFGSVNPSFNAVPEPSSIALLGLASIAGLGLVVSRRKRK